MAPLAFPGPTTSLTESWKNCINALGGSYTGLLTLEDLMNSFATSLLGFQLQLQQYPIWKQPTVDHGVTDFGPSIQAALNANPGLPLGIQAYTSGIGIGTPVFTNPGQPIFCSGQMPFESVTSNPGPGGCTGTLFMPAHNWTPVPPDTTVDTAATYSSGSSAISSTNANVANAGRPLGGYGIPSGSQIGTGIHGPVNGVGYTICNASNTPVNATQNGVQITMGTGLTPTGLINFAKGSWIQDATFCGDGAPGGFVGEIGCYSTDQAVHTIRCTFGQWKIAGSDQIPGSAAGAGQDNWNTDCFYTNTLIPAPQTYTVTARTGALLTLSAPLNSLNNVQANIVNASSIANVRGAKVDVFDGGGNLISGSANFVAQGGVNANGANTLLCTGTISGTAATARVYNADVQGIGARMPSADNRVNHMHIAGGQGMFLGADCIIHGIHFFGDRAGGNYQAVSTCNACTVTAYTLDPGPGHDPQAWWRVDAGVTTFTGGLIETNSLAGDTPLFEDNGASALQINGLGLANQSSTHVSMVIHHQSGAANPKSSIDQVFLSNAVATAGFVAFDGTGRIAKWYVNNNGTILQSYAPFLTSTLGSDAGPYSNDGVFHNFLTLALTPGTWYVTANAVPNAGVCPIDFQVVLAGGHGTVTNGTSVCFIPSAGVDAASTTITAIVVVTQSDTLNFNVRFGTGSGSSAGIRAETPVSASAGCTNMTAIAVGP